MPNYSNGKIYSIRFNDNDKLIYIGSTTQILAVRFGGHKKKSNNSLYQYIQDNYNGDFKCCYIELLEPYACNNKNELDKKEGEFIRQYIADNNNIVINRRIAGRDRKQYYEDNVEKLKEQKKQYYQENTDKIKEQKRQYYQENTDKIKEKERKYRQTNTDIMKEKDRLYYQENADKAKEYQKQYYQENADKVKEYQKQYNQENTDKIKEKRKQYYLKKKAEAGQI